VTRPSRGLGRPSGRAGGSLLLVIAALATVVLGAACGPGAGAAGASPVATTSVDLPPSYRFEPASITVPAGSTVTWTNDDHFTHSVQLLAGDAATDPQLMEPGATASVTFATPGTFPYQCHLHPQDMQGTVTVTP
jgi:plastocyanin